MRWNFEIGGFGLIFTIYRYDFAIDMQTLFSLIVTRKYVKHYGVHLASHRSCPFWLQWAVHFGSKAGANRYELSLPVRRIS